MNSESRHPTIEIMCFSDLCLDTYLRVHPLNCSLPSVTISCFMHPSVGIHNAPVRSGNTLKNLQKRGMRVRDSAETRLFSSRCLLQSTRPAQSAKQSEREVLAMLQISAMIEISCLVPLLFLFSSSSIPISRTIGIHDNPSISNKIQFLVAIRVDSAGCTFRNIKHFLRNCQVLQAIPRRPEVDYSEHQENVQTGVTSNSIGETVKAPEVDSSTTSTLPQGGGAMLIKGDRGDRGDRRSKAA
ncbi:hypothetical protein BGZ60DRAFT_188658 [Tricladium varicosporioides]|nr:hypothetical protein BGZ60DRAFT_188658 [Hymenoscyphus varicosporioides]